jgi:acyl carrier protein
MNSRVPDSAVVARIRDILVADLAVDPAAAAASDLATPLLGRGIGLDSIEAMVLALALEHEFDIEIPDSDLTEALFESLGALAEYVCRVMADQPA